MNRYPLTWPAGWPRAHPMQRKDGQFKTRGKPVTVHNAIARVQYELRRLGVEDGDSIISTNMETRLDGLPRADSKVLNGDAGCAVYWQKRGESMKVMAIDIYTVVADNLAAIAATLEAMRAIERHGGSMILERAFTGFDALPAPGQSKHWRDILDVSEGSGNKADQLARAKAHYRALASKTHPDKEGGSDAAMAELNRAWEQAQKELS